MSSNSCIWDKPVHRTLRSRIPSCSTGRRAPPRYRHGLSVSSAVFRHLRSSSLLLAYSEARCVALGALDQFLGFGIVCILGRRVSSMEECDLLHALGPCPGSSIQECGINSDFWHDRAHVGRHILIHGLATQFASYLALRCSVAVEIDWSVSHRFGPLGGTRGSEGLIRQSPDATIRKTGSADRRHRFSHLVLAVAEPRNDPKQRWPCTSRAPASRPLRRHRPA